MDKEKASAILLKRLDDKVAYDVPKLEEYKDFKQKTEIGIIEGQDDFKVLLSKFERFQNEQQAINR